MNVIFLFSGTVLSFGMKVRSKESKLISRTFFKTEWMKPKFDVTKPYTASRDKTGPRAVPEQRNASEKVATIKKAKGVVYEHGSVECSNAELKKEAIILRKSYSNVEIPKCCHINKHLNIERMLIPQMVSLSCVLVRYYSTGRGKKPDIFWRPKDRIPDSNNMIIKLRNPATRKEALAEIKYLFLDYGQFEHVKKKNLVPDPPNVHKRPHPWRSAI